MERAGDTFRRETMATLRIAFLSALVLELVAMLAVALVAGTVGVQLAEGRLGLETGLAVLILAPELYMPVRLLGQQFHASEDGMVAAGRIFELLDEPPSVTVPRRPQPAPDPARGALVLDAVAVSYPGRPVPALDGFTLTLEPGEHVALAGPNGAGKSTAAALVLRLLDPDAGTVRCGAVDLRETDPGEWRSRLAWLPQRPTIFAASLEENVRLAAPEAPDSALRRALAAARLDELVATLPDGPATRVGEGGRPLSAGEAQRVALARAILRDAPLIVADEPTAHLDAVTAAAAGDALLAAAAGRTLLLVTHRGELAARAGRTVLLAPAAAPVPETTLVA
jgi:ABC-type transport system involved in cytochrome bd biosynthesis fused ATPase/permease subunit